VATDPGDDLDLPQARALIATLQAELTKSQREVAHLRHQLDVLCRRLFGKKAHRVDPAQPLDYVPASLRIRQPPSSRRARPATSG
jgi:outer membrane protein TolC